MANLRNNHSFQWLEKYISHSKAIYDWVLYMQWLYTINWYIYNIVVKLTFFNIYFILHFYTITFIIFKIIISYFINQYCCIIIIENWKNWKLLKKVIQNYATIADSCASFVMQWFSYSSTTCTIFSLHKAEEAKTFNILALHIPFRLCMCLFSNCAYFLKIKLM